jgi:hypothetical protein
MPKGHCSNIYFSIRLWSLYATITAAALKPKLQGKLCIFVARYFLEIPVPDIKSKTLNEPNRHRDEILEIARVSADPEQRGFGCITP